MHYNRSCVGGKATREVVECSFRRLLPKEDESGVAIVALIEGGGTGGREVDD